MQARAVVSMRPLPVTAETMIAMPRLCRYATDYSPVPLLFTEGRAHIVRYVNPAFRRLCGKERMDLLGLPFGDLFPGETQGLALLDRVYAAGQTGSPTGPEPAGDSASGLLWAYTAWAVPDRTQQSAGVMLQVTDTSMDRQVLRLTRELNQALMLSELRQHEQIEDVERGVQRVQQALRETDHRVKNNLQSVGALLDMLVMANADVVPVRELSRLRGHILTLVNIQKMLVKDVRRALKADTMSAREIIEELLPIWQMIVGEEGLAWSAEEVRLPTQQGISLAVLIHELVNNAIKHGGRTVSLQFTTSGGTAALEVCDDGPGFPMPFVPGDHAHFGLELVESVSRADMRGETAYTNRPDGGARVTITFPLPSGVAEG